MPRFLSVGLCLLLPFLLLAWGGCDAFHAQESAFVSVRFRTVLADGVARVETAQSGMTQLRLEDARGTLLIHDLRLIVGGVKLAGAGVRCPHGVRQAGDCGYLLAPPYIIDIPFDARTVEVANGPLVPGTYERLEMDVEMLGLGNDPDRRLAAQHLAALAQMGLEDWPDDAGMLIEGIYTPTDGMPRPFRTFGGGELALTLTTATPLTIGPGARRQIVVDIDPAAWLHGLDGNLYDFSIYDYAQTNRRLKALTGQLPGGFGAVTLRDL